MLGGRSSNCTEHMDTYAHIDPNTPIPNDMNTNTRSYNYITLYIDEARYLNRVRNILHASLSWAGKI